MSWDGEHEQAAPRARGILRAPRVRAATTRDWVQLLRFAVVGASGYVVNLVVFALAMGAGTSHVAAAVIAFCVAWCSNFLLNRRWTFGSRDGSPWGQAWRYLAVALLGLGLNLVLLEALVSAGEPELASQALSIAASTPVTFLLSRRWTFR